MATLDERITALEHRLLVLEQAFNKLKEKDIFSYHWNSAARTMEYIRDQDD